MVGVLQRLMLMTAHDPLETSGFRTVNSSIHTSSAENLSTLGTMRGSKVLSGPSCPGAQSLETVKYKSESQRGSQEGQRNRKRV